MSPARVLDTPGRVLDTPERFLDTPTTVLDTPVNELDTPRRVCLGRCGQGPASSRPDPAHQGNENKRTGEGGEHTRDETTCLVSSGLERCQANMAHIRQTGPESGLVSRVKFPRPLKVVSSLGSGAGEIECEGLLHGVG